MIFKIYKPTFFLMIILFSFAGYSQGDLMIMPKRLVFDGSQRAQEIHLANTGTDSSTYSISFVQYKMTDTGTFEQITEPEEGQRFASDFLRYYPRTVTLGPKEAQTLRVQLTKSSNLEDGEYRSHMYFRAVEKQTALGEDSELESEENISIKIKTVFGISIPIIIKKGEDTASIEFSDLNVNKAKEVPELTMVLNRLGNMSVYGNIDVTYISPDGKSLEVAKIKGIAVYTPNKQRLFTLQLNIPENINLSAGQLKVVYNNENGNELGEATIDLN